MLKVFLVFYVGGKLAFSIANPGSMNDCLKHRLILFSSIDNHWTFIHNGVSHVTNGMEEKFVCEFHQSKPDSQFKGFTQ